MSNARPAAIRYLFALVVGGLVAIGSCVSYAWNTEDNPVTGESQRVAMSTDEEVALGRAEAPKLAAQFGGLDPDAAAQAAVDGIGGLLVRRLQDATDGDLPFEFDFHLLDDRGTANAFALPGGQIFVTEGLYRLLRDEQELAGVLGHEIGHVVHRHASERLAVERRNAGYRAAAETVTGDGRLTGLATMMSSLAYGREQEIEADAWSVTLLSDAGYNPRAMLRVIDTLERAARGAGGPEFLSTHPASDSRREAIVEAIDALEADTK